MSGEGVVTPDVTAHDAITFAVRDHFRELWASGDDIAEIALAALEAAGFVVLPSVRRAAEARAVSGDEK
jgi:hypothetical protein